LWTYNKEIVWNSFDTRFTKIKDVHVKFEPYNFLKIEEVNKDLLVEIKEKPMLIAININLPIDYESPPIALAQIITRGVWIISVSMQQK
jgi:hypothetical protein